MAERIYAPCARCGGTADFVERCGRRHVASFDPDCDRGRECVAGWAEQLGCRPYQVLDASWPLPLGIGRTFYTGGTPAALPTKAQIDGCHERLLASDEPLDYVLSRVTLETVRRARMCWDGEDLGLPIPDVSGAIVNYRRRKLGPGQPFRGLSGRGSQLYPVGILRRWKTALLVAGEIDALVAREHRLPAVTTTCGASLPDHLVPALSRRRVAVAYDVGEEGAAARTVAKLDAAGGDAWVVRLGQLGLPPKGDLSDYFRDGGTRRELVDLIHDEQEAQ